MKAKSTTELARRKFLQQAGLYFAATSATCAGCNLAFGQSYRRGCALTSANVSVSDIFMRLDNDDFNRLMYATAEVLNDHTGFEPSFGFMKEDYGYNAFALQEDVVRGYSEHGSVLFGLNLINHLWEWPTLHTGANYAAIHAVMAHEWAHIAQFAHGINTSRVVRMELMADFIAGWEVARSEAFGDEYKRARGKHDKAAHDDSAGAMTVITSLGDYAFNSADHHGTPRQRLAAYTHGIKFFREYPKSKFEDVFEVGKQALFK